MKQKGYIEVVVGVGLVMAAIIFIVVAMLVYPQYHVYSQRLEGEAILARADQERRVLISQAQAEKEAAQLRADAIKIMGEAAHTYPEYRQQEFIGAFAEAVKDGKISQIIYVPTEANIPITEAHRH